MKKPGTMNEKLYSVKILANKLDGQVDSDPKHMLQNINAKIKMINHFIEL